MGDATFVLAGGMRYRGRDMADAPSFCVLHRKNQQGWWQRQVWPTGDEVHVWTCVLDATDSAGEIFSVMAGLSVADGDRAFLRSAGCATRPFTRPWARGLPFPRTRWADPAAPLRGDGA